MRIKEGQTLELKNGQTISAEEEIERFANVLAAASVAYYLLYPRHYEKDRALVEAEGKKTEGKDVVRLIAREMYDKAVMLDEMIYEIFAQTDLSEDEKEALLQGLAEAFSDKEKEDDHE